MREMIDSLGHVVSRAILPTLLGVLLGLVISTRGATASPDPIRRVPAEIRDAGGEHGEDAELHAQFDAAMAEAQRTEAALKQLNDTLTGPGAPAKGSSAREALLEVRFAAKVAYEQALNRFIPLAAAQKAANEQAQKAALDADEAFDKARCLVETEADEARVEFCNRRGVAVPKKLARAERGP